MVGREEVVCACGSVGGKVDDKVGEGDKRDDRENSHQPGRRLRGGKVTGRYETGRKETVRKETGGKTMGTKATGAKAPGAQYSQETGGKGDMLMDEKEMDIILPDNKTRHKGTDARATLG